MLRSNGIFDAHFKVNWPQGQERTAWAAWGITKTLRGTICVKKNSLYSNLESVIPTTHSLKSLFTS